MDSIVFILSVFLLIILPIIKWKRKAVIILTILFAGGFVTCGGNIILAQYTGAFNNELQGVGFWILFWIIELFCLFFLGIWLVNRPRKNNI